jgi:hypothetical protein
MMKIKIEAAVHLDIDGTELQMLYEAVRRVRPFAEMSREMLHISAGLERELHDAILKLPE